MIMKESTDKNEGRTVLILDSDYSIAEISFRSIFNNLLVFQNESEKALNFIQRENVQRIILATDDRQIATEVLLMYEKNKIEVVPFEFVNVDATHVAHQTLVDLVYFEFYKFNLKTFRSKINFYLKSNLSNIKNIFLESEIKFISIEKEPILYYNLLKSVLNNDSILFLEFSKLLNNLCKDNDSEITSDLSKLVQYFEISDKIAYLFVENINLLFESSDDYKYNYANIDFFNNIALSLKKDIFKINKFNWCLLLMNIAFDHENKYSVLEFLSGLVDSTNKYANSITIFTLSTIFNNQSFLDKKFKYKDTDISKTESMLEKSSIEFIKIAKSTINESSFSERFELANGFVDYFQFLINGSQSSDLTASIKKYVLTDD